MKFRKPNMPSQYPRSGSPPLSLLFAHQFSQTPAKVRNAPLVHGWNHSLVIALKTACPETRLANKTSPNGPKARA